MFLVFQIGFEKTLSIRTYVGTAGNVGNHAAPIHVTSILLFRLFFLKDEVYLI
jgi:hypothetical protein